MGVSGGGLRLKTEPNFVPQPDGAMKVARQDEVMYDPESAYALMTSDLAHRRAPALQRAALAWDPNLADAPPTQVEDCCASGDCDDAA